VTGLLHTASISIVEVNFKLGNELRKANRLTGHEGETEKKPTMDPNEHTHTFGKPVPESVSRGQKKTYRREDSRFRSIPKFPLSLSY